eukprot:TRINITY_DN20705_c0_g1_i1.p1 TRINITY_DN20705_c0_g1~~TRINITY_DN20705_c0_g1_i1.p1  ORF type:complete len:310 (+),score=99.44 TRINITY_DN20705_c0_g1_i1:72-932(+)
MGEKGEDGLQAPPAGSMVLAKNSFDVKGRYFIVTGGTQGLGKRIAVRLAENGAEGITICGRNDDKGQKVKKLLEELGVKNVAYVKADLTKEEDARAVVVEASRIGQGRVDGLINAAGSSPRATMAQAKVEDWDNAFNLNVRPQFILTKEASELMKQRGKGGVVVNISSINALCGMPSLVGYSAAKAALNCLTKNNAMELQEHKIRVNAINLGWALTEAEDELQTKEKGENWLEKAENNHPNGRLLRADDIANVVGFLISDAASMITGTIIDVHPEMITGALPKTVG